MVLLSLTVPGISWGQISSGDPTAGCDVSESYFSWHDYPLPQDPTNPNAPARIDLVHPRSRQRQGNCGICHTFSLTQEAEIRYRIWWHRQTGELLDPRYPVNFSEEAIRSVWFSRGYDDEARRDNRFCGTSSGSSPNAIFPCAGRRGLVGGEDLAVAGQLDAGAGDDYVADDRPAGGSRRVRGEPEPGGPPGAPVPEVGGRNAPRGVYLERRNLGGGAMLRRRMMGTCWIAWVGCLIVLVACDSPDKRNWDSNNYFDNDNNYNPYCDLRPPQCPPCDDQYLCSLPAECWTSPPDCAVCPNTFICPKPDGGFDVVGDVVRPDIPDTEPDPHLYMVECAAMTGGGLPGYLGYYGTWGNMIIIGHGNFPSATERYTQLYVVDMEDMTIRDIGSVPEVDAHISEALVIEEASRMAFFITSRWEVPAGCTQSYCRYEYGTLWGIELDTLTVLQITQEATLPLESEYCHAHHGTVGISAIDTVNQWVTVDCMVALERGEGSGSYMAAYETYRVHLVTGEIQYLTHAEEKTWVPSASPIDSGSNRYRFIWSQPWNAEMTGREGEPFGFHVWDLQGPVPELVYEQYYGRNEIASGTGVAADGWYYWNELIDGHLQIRGVDVVTGDTLTTSGTTFEKAGAHPAGRAVPHLVSFFGGVGFVDYMGMIATTREGIYLWDKEQDVIRRATTNLPFFKGAFFNGTESTKWLLLTTEVGSETCLFVRDLHAAGVIDPLTNRLLPEE